MKDFPVFTTQNGVASLILKQIPYLQTAYIRIQDSMSPDALLQECVDFCRICGAEHIYASGHSVLSAYPLYTAMWHMQCSLKALEQTDAMLFPVQEKTLSAWRDLYNQKVKQLPNGAWMSLKDADDMIKKGDGYFIHRNGVLLGIGRASGDMIDWVASVQNGAGREVVLALAHALVCDTVHLTVASVNEKAVRLYESLGFVKTEEISVWHKIL